MRLYLLTAITLLSLLRSESQAATVRACWDTLSVSPDTATVQFIADGSTILSADILASSTVSAPGKSCSLVAFPAGLTRGVDHPMTLRAVNAFGEVGGAGTPVTFHAPLVPPALAGVTVQAVVGP